MSGSVVLHLYLLGLMVIVPDGRATLESARAYIIDARAATRPHTPFLGFLTEKKSECPSPPCVLDAGFCGCQIGQGDIRFVHQPIDYITHLPRKPTSDLPVNDGDGQDLEWLLRMENANPEARGILDDLGTLVLGSFSFSWESAEVCQLAELTPYPVTHPDQHFVATYQTAPGSVQSLAEVVMFEVPVPNLPIIIENNSFGRLEIPCGSYGCNLIIGNSRQMDPCDKGEVGEDFPLYYAIARTKPQRTFKPTELKTTGTVHGTLCAKAFAELKEGAESFIRDNGIPDPSDIACIALRVESEVAQGLLPFQAGSVVAAFFAEVAGSASGRPICPMVVMDP